MKFLQYSVPPSEEKHLGVVYGSKVIDLKSLDPALPQNMLNFLRGSSNVENISKKLPNTDGISLSEVKVHAPIESCDKVVCVGMNYLDHCKEQLVDLPKEPMFFNKFSSSIAGPFDDVKCHKFSEQLDYEVELAIIIGKKGYCIPQNEAMEYVFGYTVANDLSARDLQFKKNGGQWLLGKAIDGYCPLGPYIVTKDELFDPHNLDIKCSVNGKIVQSSNTSQMIHRVDTIVSFFSNFCSLLPGDVILTGTPAGVGVFRTPPCFLKEGDVVSCEIQGIGLIRNCIV